MIFKFASRMLTEPDKRVLWKFCYNFGWKGLWATERFKRRVLKDDRFPPFLFISLTNNCNLLCQGCWIHSLETTTDMTAEQADRIIAESKKRGVRFFGILGGEPFMHPELFDILARHPDCYFQVFTNGTLIRSEQARRMRELGNITPLISVEGLRETSDERRGGKGIYESAMEGLRLCRENRLIFGVATSVCRSNYDELVQASFIEDVIDRGAHYLWYYVYRPVGSIPTPELALSREQILGLRRFLVGMRSRAPIALLDTYWDHAGRGVCPAATGLSYHINPLGDVEPCPPIQFARENVLNDPNGFDKIAHSPFLKGFSELAAQTGRGCILLDDPQALRRFVLAQSANDTSGRDGLKELAAMTQLPSHDLEGDEIPEVNFFYRFAKKHWFFGFGAYG